jgi:hypothetical protein
LFVFLNSLFDELKVVINHGLDITNPLLQDLKILINLLVSQLSAIADLFECFPQFVFLGVVASWVFQNDVFGIIIDIE